MEIEAIEAGALPAPLDEVKALLRIASSDEDALLAGTVRAAADLCERFTGRLLIAREVREILPCARAWQRLAAAPVRSIDAVAALDESGAATALDVAAYAIDIDARGEGWVRLLATPAQRRVRATYVAGLGAGPGDLPEALRQGVARLAAHLFVHRDAAGTEPPAAVTALWRPWRRLRLG